MIFPSSPSNGYQLHFVGIPSTDVVLEFERRVTSAPTNGNTARAINAPVKLFVRLRTRPIRYGPAKPPRFPIELINAIPAAAAVPASIREDMAQRCDRGTPAVRTGVRGGGLGK